MEMMQQAQEFGQPPIEIVEAIAPGIELDENGLPKVGADEDCRIM
jgi:peroxin-19